MSKFRLIFNGMPVACGKAKQIFKAAGTLVRCMEKSEETPNVMIFDETEPRHQVHWIHRGIKKVPSLVRSFTKEDWYGYAGASAWSDGTQPMVRYEHNWEGVADRNGFQILLDDETWVMHLGIDQETGLLPNFARHTLQNLPIDLDRDFLKEMGFAEI